MSFEFENRLNWNLVTRLDLEAVKTDTDPVIYGQISTRSVLVNKRILMIGCSSRSASPRWRFACWASKRLLITPSVTSNLPALCHTEKLPCWLNTQTLLKFKPDGPLPYLLLVEIPHWIKHLYIELWEYDGPDEEIEPTQT